MDLVQHAEHLLKYRARQVNHKFDPTDLKKRLQTLRIQLIIIIIIIVDRPFSMLRTGWTFSPNQAPPTRSLNL